jgi:hypothetical protein
MPYDPAVDPNLARQTLRILPDSPLTVELVERAFAGESWERHPSRYQDASARRQAEQWAQTLIAARDILLAEARRPPTSAPGAVATAPSSDPGVVATAPSPRRGLSRGGVIGIVAGSVAVLALITFVVIGVANLATNAITTATETLESAAADFEELPDVDRYQSGETQYEFFAALEIYNDGRHDAKCSLDYAQGCWQMALFTEADCNTMEVELGFTDDVNAYSPDHVETVEKHDVLGNEATVVVFGNDNYDFGWINQVTCLDSTS